MWGSALVSEGGRGPQNSLTGSNLTSKRSRHGISIVWKVVITIVSIHSRSTGIVGSRAEQRARFSRYLIKDEVISLELKPKAGPLN